MCLCNWKRRWSVYVENSVSATVCSNSPSLCQGSNIHRNHVPWAIITTTNLASAVTLLILRYLYSSENKRRDRETRDVTYDSAYLQDESGGKKVDKAFLDLTDNQNRDFRYVL